MLSISLQASSTSHKTLTVEQKGYSQEEITEKLSSTLAPKIVNYKRLSDKAVVILQEDVQFNETAADRQKLTQPDGV